MVDEFRTTTFVAATPPNLTVAPLENPTPVIVMEVPPRLDPPVGDTDVTMFEGAYVNALAFVALTPFGFVTTTSTMPST
jgi:hypothetical protein